MDTRCCASGWLRRRPDRFDRSAAGRRGTVPDLSHARFIPLVQEFQFATPEMSISLASRGRSARRQSWAALATRENVSTNCTPIWIMRRFAFKTGSICCRFRVHVSMKRRKSRGRRQRCHSVFYLKIADCSSLRRALPLLTAVLSNCTPRLNNFLSFPCRHLPNTQKNRTVIF